MKTTVRVLTEGNYLLGVLETNNNFEYNCYECLYDADTNELISEGIWVRGYHKVPAGFNYNQKYNVYIK